MRKFLTKEITFTHFNLSKMEIHGGVPTAVEMGTEKLLGNIKPEKVQKQMRKLYNDNSIIIYNHRVENVTYEMEIEKFIEVATPKEENKNDN